MSRRDIKKGLDASESKKNRNETTIQIRKDKKDDQLQKRRVRYQLFILCYTAVQVVQVLQCFHRTCLAPFHF